MVLRAPAGTPWAGARERVWAGPPLVAAVVARAARAGRAAAKVHVDNAAAIALAILRSQELLASGAINGNGQ